MKRSFHPYQILIIAVPLWAVTLFCLAQNPRPVVVQTTESVVTARPDLHATGNIRSFDSGGLTMVNDLGSMTVYQTDANTAYLNKQGQLISPTSLTQQTPVTVYYTRAGNSLIATRIVVSSTLFSDGTVLEASPAELVIQLAGAPATPCIISTVPPPGLWIKKAQPCQCLRRVIRCEFSMPGKEVTWWPPKSKYSAPMAPAYRTPQSKPRPPPPP